MKIDELRVGATIDLGGTPYLVLKSDFMKTAQRRPVMRTKLRSLSDGSVLEKTFKQGDKVEQADMSRRQAQYLYKENDQFHFMDQDSYEQFSINEAVLGASSTFLQEGGNVTILNYEDNPINVEFPAKVELKVTDAPPGVKGDTAQGGVKEVTLENGLKVSAPLFIKVGDIVRINTSTGKYSERATQG